MNQLEKDSLVVAIRPINRENYIDATTFNLDIFKPMLHVKLTDTLFEDYNLRCIYDKQTELELLLCDCEEHEDHDIDLYRPWIDIPTDKLNLNPGLHIYILEFYNKITQDTLLQQFYYKIQDDNPPKPYIYMKRLMMEN